MRSAVQNLLSSSLISADELEKEENNISLPERSCARPCGKFYTLQFTVLSSQHDECLGQRSIYSHRAQSTSLLAGKKGRVQISDQITSIYNFQQKIIFINLFFFSNQSAAFCFSKEESEKHLSDSGKVTDILQVGRPHKYFRMKT